MPMGRTRVMIALTCSMLPAGVAAQGLHERLQDRLPALLDSAGIPGASFALIENGTVGWVTGVGLRSLPDGPAVDSLTVFEAASLTKQVVATGVLRMAARGEIDLDTPLHEILPHPDLLDDPRARRITPRMVLSHTTGLPNWRRGQPLRTGFEPGARYGYSGEAFVWLQRVIETISGTSLAEWARHTVFEPAGMHRSSLVWEQRFEENTALPHNALGAAIRKARPADANAAASMHTTAGDYARFLTALGRGLLIDSAGLSALMTGQVAVTESISWGLGVGLQITPEGMALWHWGDNPGYKNFAFLVPATGTGLVYLSNSDGGMAIVHALLGEVHGRDQPAEIYLGYERHDSPRRYARLALDSAMVAGGPRLGIPRYRELKASLRQKLSMWDCSIGSDAGYSGPGSWTTPSRFSS
jgi:CubicO group peptidase (beta-lactamase class C family)